MKTTESTSSEAPPERTGRKPRQRLRLNPYPFWAPRFWHGMLLGDWCRLVAKHPWRIHLLRIPMAAIVTVIAAFNSLTYRIQCWIYGKRIDAVEVTRPPLFIIGHWRSGTTLLHELIVRDDQFAYPTTYECFAANHFLITGSTFPKILRFLLPSKRPMDDMAVSFNHPQEDEFALVSMGAPSPILRVAFPNDPPPHLDFLDMQDTQPDELHRWQTKLMEFVKCQTLLKNKRLVLKSPPHTGRVKILSEMFPGAQFIHIVRDPFTLFPSNCRLWRALDEAQGFQFPNHRNLDEFVFTAFERMYEGFERQRESIPAGCLAETRYEDLIQNPLTELARIYDELHLGNFAEVRDEVERYLGNKKNYQTNRYELEPAIQEQIESRWGDYRNRYGYGDDSA